MVDHLHPNDTCKKKGLSAYHDDEAGVCTKSRNTKVYCGFDREVDKVEEYTNNIIAEEELSEDQKDAFKEFLKKSVQERKRANREARQKRKQALEELSQEKLDSINESSYINRYYGKAHKDFLIIFGAKNEEELPILLHYQASDLSKRRAKEAITRAPMRFRFMAEV
ncbi:protein heat intolerant 4 [Tanacetum coccineum]